jgi:hypothetical protein
MTRSIMIHNIKTLSKVTLMKMTLGILTLGFSGKFGLNDTQHKRKVLKRSILF